MSFEVAVAYRRAERVLGIIGNFVLAPVGVLLLVLMLTGGAVRDEQFYAKALLYTGAAMALLILAGFVLRLAGWLAGIGRS